MTIALQPRRRLGTLVLGGVRAPTLVTFRRAFSAPLENRSLVVADLSLGAWRSHHTATEFSAQLSLGPATAGGPSSVHIPEAVSEWSFANVVGAFIDLEGRGDAATLAALEHSARIAELGGGDERIFAVLAPRFGLDWEREDVLFIRFLSQAFADGPDRILIVGVDDEVKLPSDWQVSWSGEPAASARQERSSLLGLIPGVVASEAAEAVAEIEQPRPEDSLSLGGGHLLVAPEARRDPRGVSRFDYDKLALATRPGGWLHAYAQVRGNNFYVDPWFLWGQAHREVEASGYGLALRFADRASECARDPLQLGITQSLAQGIRIAIHRFAEAADCADPPPAVPTGLRSFLLEMKGWALAMMDEPSRAEPYFEEADRLMKPSADVDPADVDPEYLYLLNIWALNRLKLGDARGALALEKEIEAAHARLPRRDCHLEYVNSINIARLARRRHAYDEAVSYYRRAFATTLGARTEGDCLYTNVCLARLEEERGRADDAFAAWMRAALHWAAAGVPEALASRVATAILERKVGPGETNPEEISTALEQRLLAAALAAGVERTANECDMPVFVRANALAADPDSPPLDAAVLGGGWSVVTSTLAARQALHSEAYVRLSRLLFELLSATYRQHLNGCPPTIVIDDQFGTEMPTTVPQLVALALRLRVRKLVVKGRLVELDEPLSRRLEDDLRVRLGPAVNEVRSGDGAAWAVFKRYVPPRQLSEDESRVATALTPPPAVKALRERVFRGEVSHDSLLGLLRELERSRVVELELPAKALEQAGLVVADDRVAR